MLIYPDNLNEKSSDEVNNKFNYYYKFNISNYELI